MPSQAGKSRRRWWAFTSIAPEAFSPNFIQHHAVGACTEEDEQEEPALHLYL
jgi:hypothetical protein